MAVGKSSYLDITVQPQSVGKVRVYWREDYDIEGNYSTITVTDIMGYLWPKSAWAYVYASVTADDVTVLPYTNGAWMFSAASDTTLRSVRSASGSGKTFTPVTSGKIYHDNDGTKTVTLTFKLHDLIAPDVGFDGENNLTVSQRITLTPIPRASAVSAPNGEIGSELTLLISKTDASYTHTLKYAFGEVSGVITEQTAEASCKWIPPMALCGQLPDAASGSCTLTCETYSSGTLIGTRTADVTLTVPASVGLTVSDGWAVAAPYNSGTPAEGFNVFVQGYSRAAVSFDAAKIGTENAYGASVAAYYITCQGVRYEAPYRTDVLALAGAVSITATVVDSRGRAVSEVLQVQVEAYTKPVISAVKIFRCDSYGRELDDGTYLSVTAKANISDLVGLNTAAMQLAVGDLMTVTVPSEQTMVVGDGLVLSGYTYHVTLTLRDRLDNTAVYTQTIPTAEVFFHGRQGGRGAAFGKYAETDDLLDVDWNLQVQKDLQVQGTARMQGDLLVQQNLQVDGTLSIDGKALWELVMPVGFVYISSDPTSPAALYGGTWEQITDRVLVGAGGSYPVNTTGGEAEHTLTVAEMPEHRHEWQNHYQYGGATAYSTTTWSSTTCDTGWTTYAGGGQAHNNMQPFIAKYIWERVE